jgi:hypothetical protein
MGLLKEMSMSQTEPFSCCLVDDEPGCCDFEDELLALDEVFDLSQKTFSPSVDWHIASSIDIASNLTPYFSSAASDLHPLAHAPPAQDTPRHIFFCIFLI